MPNHNDDDAGLEHTKCEDIDHLLHRLVDGPGCAAPCTLYLLRDEVCLHNRRDDAWLIVNGRVIDLSAFLCRPDVLMNPVSD